MALGTSQLRMHHEVDAAETESPEPSLALDVELARRLGAAEGQAWEQLYKAMGERVFRMTHRVTGDVELAADLTHDTFLRIADRVDQYRGRGSLEGWVFAIARNLALKALRKRGRRARHHQEMATPVTPRHVSTDVVEVRIVVEEALAELPDSLRTPLELFTVDGFSHFEIGEMLGIAEGTSKARVSRAKARMRELLKYRL